MNGESGTDRILKAKGELDSILKGFVLEYNNCNGEKICLTQLIGKVAERHTMLLNTVNQVLAEVHEENDFFKNKNLQKDYGGTVENLIPTSLNVVESINAIAAKHNINPIIVSPKSYIVVQKFVNTFSDKETRDLLIVKFQERNISTSGFKLKFYKTMKAKFLRLQLWIGIPLLLLCGAVIFTGESYLGKIFGGIQLIYLKGLFALSLSIVGSSLIEGSAHVKWSLQKGLTIRAIGWVAVFLLIYFLNPASPGDVH